MLAQQITDKSSLYDLSNEQRQEHYKKVYEETNSAQRFLGQDHKEYEGSSYIIPLREKISSLLVDKGILREPVKLEELHKNISAEMREYDFDYGVNKISTFFYENDEEFNRLYLSLIKDFIYEKVFNFPFYYQIVPTIRLHCPDAKNSNHYPRYHTDIGYGHPPEIINIWIPLTEPAGEQPHGFRIVDLGNSRKIFADENHDFNSLINKAINDKSFTRKCEEVSWQAKTPLGNMLVFDPRCLHTGEPMKDHTRVSIDIRIITAEDYSKMKIAYRGAGRSKALFEPGHSYSKETVDKL